MTAPKTDAEHEGYEQRVVREVGCIWCGASAGERCIGMLGRRVPWLHGLREEAFAARSSSTGET